MTLPIRISQQIGLKFEAVLNENNQFLATFKLNELPRYSKGQVSLKVPHCTSKNLSKINDMPICIPTRFFQLKNGQLASEIGIIKTLNDHTVYITALDTPENTAIRKLRVIN